jgi:vacuolar-type H+-ATPase subunit D/Vma8
MRVELPDLEHVTALVHAAWLKDKQTAGVTSRRLDANGEELMVEYVQLSEQAKEVNRALVRAVYQAIQELDRATASTVRRLHV